MKKKPLQKGQQIIIDLDKNVMKYHYLHIQFKNNQLILTITKTREYEGNMEYIDPSYTVPIYQNNGGE
jgi:hypothetical protein